MINLIISTYDKLIKVQKNLISNLSETDLKKLIETLSDIAVFTYDNKIDKINFFNKLEILNEDIRDKIYIELYSKYNDEKHKEDIINKEVKKYYIKSLDSGNLERFISFVEKLNFDENYYDIMDRINNTCKISENDFYSTKKNKNIILLCKLNDKKLIKKEDNIYFENCKPILETIYSEIDDTEDGKKIKISQLKSLFNCKEENYIIEKFKLFTLIKENLDDNSIYLDDNSLYKKLKGIYEKINKTLKELIYISNNFKKYFGKVYEKDIKKIEEYISNIEQGSWSYYDNIQTDLDQILGRKNEADEIDKVINLNLFNIIYRHTKGEDQKIHFENALNKLNNINDILKSKDKENKGIIDEIKQNNSLIDEEIKKYFAQQKENNELSLLVHFDSYERDIKSIFYFFDNFHNDENWNKILCPKYKDLSKENIEEYLKELKEKKIYDYESERKSKSYYIQFFNYLYQKQQAIDFLNQDHDNLNLLYEKLDPSKGMLGVKDIDDTISCVEFFSELKKFEQNEAIFNHIKDKFKGNEKLIESFKNFSDVHPTIIELNQSFDDLSLSLYDEVKLILKKAEIILEQNGEEIIIKEANESKEKKVKIQYNTVNDLFKLKNKINVKPKNTVGESENEKTLIKKNNTLLLFKDIVNNIESIYEHLLVLRKKDNILPIRIKVEIETEEEDDKENIKVKYYINDKKGKEVEKSFEYIDKYLSNAKNDFIKQLEQFYKKNDYIRFFYGRQFVTIVNHLDGYKKIFPFLRNILNDIGEEEIKTGVIINDHKYNDFIRDYEEYHKEIFENIIEYVVTLFLNNKSSLEKHYENMKIKNETLKGIYTYDSNSESMEEDILQIFLDKIGGLPIAQNILITNKETSYEELQAFLNRAILCRYNTLFAIEINESFSESQQRYLNRFIDKFLTYKCEKKGTNDKGNPKEYMDSCLVFICNDKTKSALNYIKKSITTDILKLRKPHNLNTTFVMDDNTNFSSNDNTNTFLILNTSNKNINSSKDFSNENIKTSRDILNKNIHVIKSENCGLGKTEKIKKEIKAKGKKYIHFPVGGNITRDILFKKLKTIVDKIEESENNDVKNVAIHLDLFDNNEHSILNEFLFSFLITKFYSNSENVLYIPIDIEIFVEVPNCF